MTPFPFADFEVEAQRLVTDARTKSQAILAQALAESSNVREQARVAGREEGRAEVDCVIALLNDIASGMSAAASTLRAESQRDLVRLAVAIAERVIRAEVASGREVVERNAARAMELALDPGNASIRVNPAEAGRLEPLRSRFPGISIQADAGVAPGGVIVETPRGGVDLDVKTQLDRIERELLS